MSTKPINIVWLKRDLRTQDHQGFSCAENANIDYRIVYFFEPNIITYPDTSDRHLQFIYHSIKAINKTLAPFNRSVDVFYGSAEVIFEHLSSSFDIHHIYSYRESGTKTTWQRDKKVASFAKTNDICWKEFQRDGILRGIKNRIDWSKQWHSKMHTPVLQNNFSITSQKPLSHPFLLPEKLELKLNDYSKYYQPAGEGNAWRYIKSFAEKRGFNYQKHISKPAQSRLSCSRLSPYLAWGNMSVKQAFQYIGTHPSGTKNSKAFSAMLTRLHWHCHFIQKFEVDCSYETHCINSGYELLEHTKMKLLLKPGKQGIPESL